MASVKYKRACGGWGGFVGDKFVGPQEVIDMLTSHGDEGTITFTEDPKPEGDAVEEDPIQFVIDFMLRRYSDPGDIPAAANDAYAILKAQLAEERAGRTSALREPTRDEMEAALAGGDEAFYDGWTIRRCRHCREAVAGGPTACVGCVKARHQLEKERAGERVVEVTYIKDETGLPNTRLVSPGHDLTTDDIGSILGAILGTQEPGSFAIRRVVEEPKAKVVAQEAKAGHAYPDGRTNYWCSACNYFLGWRSPGDSMEQRETCYNCRSLLDWGEPRPLEADDE